MKVYVKTFGCASNRAESEAILKLLSESPIGIEITPTQETADTVVVNSCTVRGETELKVLKYIRSLGRKKVLVTGCMAAVQPALIMRSAPNASIVSPNNAALIPGTLADPQRAIRLERTQTAPEPAPFSTGLKYTIAISRGCLGSCSYCIVRLAKGRLRSIPPDAILPLVSGAIKRGAREIQLTAQDTGNYGSDISTDLPSLIGRVSLIPGDFRIRIGMFNPSSIIPLLDPLISSYASRKVYKFAHIPLQSGSRAILQSMDRRYTPDAFLSIVKSFRAAYPSISLATDIIVGYPGETEDDFSDTFALLAEAHPDKTHIARFSPRPHTPAASLKQVPEPLKKKRSSAIVRLKREIQLENNSHWIGHTVDATVLDMRGSLMMARTDEYKPVSIAGYGRLPMLGERVSVAIESCTPYSLAGSINRR